MPGLTTKIIHADRKTDIEHGAIHKPIHTSVAYGYSDYQKLIDVFQGTEDGYIYSRQSNPTTTLLENKITLLEDGFATVCFSTGMAAIGSTLFSLLRKDDHIISSVHLFGNTNSLLETLSIIGCDVTLVDATNINNVEKAIRPSTRLVFIETIANPCTQVADLPRIGILCKRIGLLYIVDNTLTSGYLFQPKNVEASLVINSLTKNISGHGNVLGGSVTDTGIFNWNKFPNINDIYKGKIPQYWGITQIRKKGLRDFGGALPAESAHKISIGAETLVLRLDRTNRNAYELAQFLSKHPAVSDVFYPGISTHPQHKLSQKIFRAYGSLLSIELADYYNWSTFLTNLNFVILSSHLGDNRTLAIPVSHTIYWEMGSKIRSNMGIKDSLIRISVGIEDIDDLIADFDNALYSSREDLKVSN
ncbi:MAG: cystathionine gamma-synthase family protein [Piscirickettsiaceae bacterium]|nr:cystathionine gamma-synthase family protein [Piscirickettsiaceae bacterium]